jgi:hypothetical protein
MQKYILVQKIHFHWNTNTNNWSALSSNEHITARPHPTTPSQRDRTHADSTFKIMAEVTEKREKSEEDEEEQGTKTTKNYTHIPIQHSK